MPWEIRSDFTSGDLGFDPLGLKPTDPAELKEMQTKELQNGRLGMIAAAGMIAQELASNQKLFMLSVGGQEATLDGEASKKFDGEAYAKELPGVLPPMGFFDPMGFCSADDITEGKIKFYREVEIKHGRVAMAGCARHRHHNRTEPYSLSQLLSAEHVLAPSRCVSHWLPGARVRLHAS